MRKVRELALPDHTLTVVSGLGALRMPPNRHNTSISGYDQREKLSKSETTCQERRGLRLLIFDSTKKELPEKLRNEVLRHDPAAVIRRDWTSVLAKLDDCDVVIDYCDDIRAVLRRINELWRFRVGANYATRPAYIAISTPSRPSLARFEVERLGERFLHVDDVPARFGEELRRIDFRISHLARSSPHWLIAYEGNGKTLQASVSFFGPQGLQLVRAEDGLAAEVAALITRNGIPRSIAAWRKIMIGNPLFKPSRGGFNVPSRTTLRMHIHRDYIRALQRAFDEARAGYCAKRVLERLRLGEKTVGYRIKGRWDAVRR
jgi:hypothetical protein